MRRCILALALAALAACQTPPPAPATDASAAAVPTPPEPPPPEVTASTTPAPAPAPAPAAETAPVPTAATEAPATAEPAAPPLPPATAAAVMAPPAKAPVPLVPEPLPASLDWLTPATWQDLPGWKQDDLGAAWPALLQSCSVLQRQPAWQRLCAAAGQLKNPTAGTLRSFLQRRCSVYQVVEADGSRDGLVTGYYEPLLHGSRQPDSRFRYPIHAPPEDMLVVDLAGLYPELQNLRLRGRLQGNRVVPYFSRGEIDAGLAPLRGKELAWVADPIELFFLQVQGSGRIRLGDGTMLRVGYAEHNGHPYRSIGKWLVERGELSLDKASMQGIKDWARRNPGKVSELLGANPSYVFFRELPHQEGGPLGALGVPLTPERSIAVDPRAIPLGAPVWLATTRPYSSQPLNRLVVAQDTGSAIRGNVRADFFWGFGDEAGQKAGAMKQKGQMWVLLPVDHPLAANGPTPKSGP